MNNEWYFSPISSDSTNDNNEEYSPSESDFTCGYSDYEEEPFLKYDIRK